MPTNSWNTDFRKSNGSFDTVIKLAIKAGQLAPSTHNSQPWEVKIKDSSVELFDLDKNLRQADPENRYKWMSIGGFVENFSVVMEYYGYKTEVKITDKNITLTPKKYSPQNDSLIIEINQRYSEKRVFKSRPIEKDVFRILSQLEGVSFMSQDAQIINKFAVLQYEASRKYKNNKYFARELSSWMNIRSKRTEGMNSKSSGLTRPKLIVGKLSLKITPKILDKMSLKYKHLVECSSAVGFISVASKDKVSLINAGRQLEQLALTATKHKLSMTPLAAIIEDHDSFEILKSMQTHREKLPVIFFRISDVKNPIHHTTRKSYNKVLRS